MKKSFAQKHPFITVFLFGLLCTFMTALGAAVPQIIGLEEDQQLIVTTVFLVISVVLGIFIMVRSRYRLADYGFQSTIKGGNQKVLWYTPLVIMEIIPIAAFGFSSKITAIQYVLIACFTIAVGFNEEIYFRGLSLKAMETKSRKKAIIWSAVIFGVLHIINALNGKSPLYVVLQMSFAFLVGFVLAEIVSVTKSLWFVIIWHAAHDFIASTTSDALDSKALIVLGIQVGILLIYAILIWRKSVEEEPVLANVNE
jgi:membrane protease YdiL (CAAX protease family)